MFNERPFLVGSNNDLSIANFKLLLTTVDIYPTKFILGFKCLPNFVKNFQHAGEKRCRSCS